MVWRTVTSWVTSSPQDHIETNNLEPPTDLTCMFSDCVRKLENPERTLTDTHRENTQTPQKCPRAGVEPTVSRLCGSSANHCAIVNLLIDLSFLKPSEYVQQLLSSLCDSDNEKAVESLRYVSALHHIYDILWHINVVFANFSLCPLSCMIWCVYLLYQ